MTRPQTLFGTLAILLALAGSDLMAGLEWKTTLVKREAGLEDQSAKAVYEFKNTGDKPVTIKSVTSSCGCTTASDASGVYEPGQSGKIEVEFKFQGRKGLQQKTIIVETPDLNPQLQVLTLSVQIPNDILLSKEFLTWGKGAAADEQTFEVKLMNPKIKLTTVTSTHANFTARFEEIEPGKLLVKVKPGDTTEPIGGVMRLDFSEPAPRTMFLPVRIKN